MAGAAMPRPRKRPRRGKDASLPIDLLPDIAARSDPATLVRCAATCKEVRRHIANPAFHGRLRLRHYSQRFVPSLLRGGLIERYDGTPRLVGNTTAAVTRLLGAAACFPPAEDGETVMFCRPVAARDGLILVQGTIGWWLYDKLCVCCPATGRTQVLPPEPRFHGQYALFVGDGEGGAVGRHFQVLKACFLKPAGGWCSLQIYIFSSEQGTWAPPIRSSNPLIMNGEEVLHRPGNSVVVGDTVHWLYHLNRTYYLLKVHVKAARVTFTELPKSFHRACRFLHDRTTTAQILLATSSSGRSPVVLVASNDMISAWTQSEPSGKWSKRPQLIKDCGAMKDSLGSLRLKWFAERSGLVLVTARDDTTFLLDLQSKDIIKCSSSSYSTIAYEMDVSSWVPTFTKTF